MKVKYSASSQRMAVTAPKPTARPAAVTLSRGSLISSCPKAATRRPQLTKWFASSHQSMVS
jgi:hypothetical protein